MRRTVRICATATEVRSAEPELDHEGTAERGRSGRISDPAHCAAAALQMVSAAAGHANTVTQVDPYPAAAALRSRPRRWLRIPL